MSLSQWHTTAADNASAGTINWAEGQSPATVNDSARQTMADVRTWYEGMEWRDWGHTPVYSAATAFTISSSSSLTSIYAINRRIKTIDSVTTSYGTIVDTTWVSSTQTVHVDNSVSLSNPMTSVAVGFDAANKPIHVSGVFGAASTADAVLQAVLTQPGDMLFASATATAARLAVGSTTSVLVTDASGMPTWTAHPTLAGVGIGNVTSVQTAGAVYAQNGFYEGTTKIPKGLLSRKIFSATASLSFGTADFDWTQFDVLEFEFTGIIPGTNNVSFLARLSTDGGVTPISTARYQISGVGRDSAGTDNGNNAGNQNAYFLTGAMASGGIANTAAYGLSGELRLYNFNSTSLFKVIESNVDYRSGASTQALCVTSGCYDGTGGDTTAMNGIVFLVSSGTFSGMISAYGRRNS